jgi:hypothetical protein
MLVISVLFCCGRSPAPAGICDCVPRSGAYHPFGHRLGHPLQPPALPFCAAVGHQIW